MILCDVGKSFVMFSGMILLFVGGLLTLGVMNYMKFTLVLSLFLLALSTGIYAIFS